MKDKIVVKNPDILPEGNILREFDIALLLENGDKEKTIAYKVSNDLTAYKRIVYFYVFAVVKGKKAIVVLEKETEDDCKVSECVILTDEEINTFRSLGFKQL